MIKLLLTFAVVGSFAVGSALAGSGGCGSSCGDKKKGGKPAESTKESVSYQVTL